MAATGASERRRRVLSVLEEYEGPLRRFATRLLRDEDAARDVVQHAFLQLCDRASDPSDDEVGRWLFTVCRNKAVDVLRTRTRTVPLPARETSMGASKEPDPADTVEKREIHRQLGELVAELPQAQCEAIGLWSEGFSYREIAEITDRSEGSIRLQVHRAIKRLARHPIARQLIGST